MKYEKEFPIFKTKIEGITKKFDLSDLEGRKEYFEAKSGEDIAKLKKYFSEGKTFIKKELVGYMNKNYRGYISVEDGINALLGRDQKTLLPTEFILALVKMEISKIGKKSIFIDGFPRNLDQVSYSLFFKELIGFRDDPDVFVAIDIPEAVIDERMKNRVVCPVCHTPRNLKLFTTKEVGYDEETKEFFLKCDNPDCNSARMSGKEGDNMGIESIRGRLELDGKLIDKVFLLHGMPRILLRNAVPVATAAEFVDDYEITPEYYYEYDETNKAVKTLERPFIVKDDEGVEVYSLLAPPVAMALIKQLVKTLGL
jgi:adenylate kinase family enzyme